METECDHNRTLTLGPEDPLWNRPERRGMGWIVCGNHRDRTEGCFAQSSLPVTWQVGPHPFYVTIYQTWRGEPL